MRLLSVLVVAGVAAKRVAKPHAPRAGRIAMMASFGGDLGEGSDSRRNEQLQSLRRAFFAPDADVGADQLLEARVTSPSEEDTAIGLLRDVPLVRWPWEILPHHQIAKVVHEPQYTLLFEQLLATPPPNYYVHLLLHGGTSSLGLNEFALRSGSKAALAGTLMRVCAVERLADARLVLLVQGLGRVQVLRQTQQVPFSRADVLLAPDVELLRAGARLSRSWLRRTGQLHLLDTHSRTRLALASAAADDAYWQPLELSNASVYANPTPRLCALNARHWEGDPSEAAQRALDVLPQQLFTEDVGRGVLKGESLVAPQSENAAEHPVSALNLSAAVDASYGNESAWHTQWLRSLLDGIEDEAVESEARLMRAALDGTVTVPPIAVAEAAQQAEAVDASEAEEEHAMLRELELQVWLELDNLVDPDGARGEGASVFMTDANIPAELLCLLPPPPSTGWPDGFGLQQLAEGTRARARLETLVGSSAGALQVATALDEPYPLLRRAGRLSFAIWAVIGDQEGAPLQRVLEVTSIAERLRVAVLRMRRLTGRTFRPPGE